MGCILLFKNPEDELKYLEFKRQKRIKRIHLIKKLLTCLKEEDFELYYRFILDHKIFKRRKNKFFSFKNIRKLWNIF